VRIVGRWLSLDFGCGATPKRSLGVITTGEGQFIGLPQNVPSPAGLADGLGGFDHDASLSFACRLDKSHRFVPRPGGTPKLRLGVAPHVSATWEGHLRCHRKASPDSGGFWLGFGDEPPSGSGGTGSSPVMSGSPGCVDITGSRSGPPVGAIALRHERAAIHSLSLGQPSGRRTRGAVQSRLPSLSPNCGIGPCIPNFCN